MRQRSRRGCVNRTPSIISLALACMSLACRAPELIEEMPRDEVWLSDEELQRAAVHLWAATEKNRLVSVLRDAVVKIKDRAFVFVPSGMRSDGRHVFKQRPV